MAQVVWSPRAVLDLEAIATYIAADSPAYASTVLRKIIALTRNLSRFPQSGRIVPELDDSSIREVFAYSYRIIYRLSGDTVLVAAVIHGKQNL